MLFHGSSQRRVTLTDLAAALYLPEEKTAALAATLCSAGFICRAPDDDAAYRYAPRDEALARAIDGLAQAYPKFLIEITHLVHDASRHNAQRFADAFKLRKDS